MKRWFDTMNKNWKTLLEYAKCDGKEKETDIVGNVWKLFEVRKGKKWSDRVDKESKWKKMADAEKDWNIEKMIIYLRITIKI